MEVFVRLTGKEKDTLRFNSYLASILIGWRPAEKFSETWRLLRNCLCSGLNHHTPDIFTDLLINHKQKASQTSPFISKSLMQLLQIIF